jgi:hypothetical protein
LLKGSRELLEHYQNPPDWSQSPAPKQTGEIFMSSSTLDALNRPVTMTAPDASVIHAFYDAAARLQQLEVYLRGRSLSHSKPVDVNVSTWLWGSSPCPGPGPNNIDWCSARGGVGGMSGTGWSNGTLANNGAPTVGFMWNAAACNSSECAFNRPWPYIRVVRFDQSTLSEIDEPDTWNPSYAFQFPG